MGEQVTTPNTWRRLLYRGDRIAPLWRALVYLLSMILLQLILSTLLVTLYIFILVAGGMPILQAVEQISAPIPPRPILVAGGLANLAAGLGMALLWGRLLDREPVETMGFDPARSGRDSLIGAAIGLGAMGSIAGLGVAAGWLSPGRGEGSILSLLVYTLALLPAAAAEEVIFRGYLRRLFTGWRGPVTGAIVTSLLFVLFHGLNPHIGPIAYLNIGLVGLILALAVERTGTLWMAIGYHLAWNVAQGPLLGMPVSGLPWEGILTLEVGGPAVLTGGPFGPEGGLLATAVLLISLVPLWAATRRPATVAAACCRQRAALERRFGPLPHTHHNIRGAGPLLDDIRRGVQMGAREGEVVLVMRQRDGSLLLHTKTFYPEEAYRLPSGGIQRGEPVTVAAEREAMEEAGVTLHDPRPLGLVTYRLHEKRRRVFFHSWLVLAGVEGEPALQDGEERISGFQTIPPGELPQVVGALCSLPSSWAGWGRFRAVAHDAASRWLEAEPAV